MRVAIKQSAGFSMLELILSMVVTSAVLTAVVLMHQPLLEAFQNSWNFHLLRSKLASPAEALAIELNQSKAIYRDNAQCYSLCHIDATSANRIYYYWVNSDLYRKEEVTTNTLACSTGQPFLRGLDTTQSAFTLDQGLLSFTLNSSGPNNSSYQIRTSLFPLNKERRTLFYDGFECNTLSSNGWSITNLGNNIYWELQNSTGSIGRYRLRANLTVTDNNGQTSYIEVPLDLSRINQAYLRFQFRSSSTMDAGQVLKVEFNDGTSLNEVFKENNGRNISSYETVVVDLSPYAHNASNKIRFSALLMKSNDDWYVDEVEVFAK